MRTKTIKLYSYAELSEEAKDKARDWYRRVSNDDDWWDAVYDDFLAIADIIGVETSAQQMQFSGFWHQGDGASFAGHYRYAKGSKRKIREYAPQDEELHRIVDELAQVQRSFFYGLTARITTSGRYSHSGTMQIEAHSTIHERHLDDDMEETLRALMRDLADWLYKRLEEEFEHLNSNEAVAEAIEANEYEFDEDGSPA